MSEQKTDNTIKGKHIQENGNLGIKEYVWHIPKPLRGSFEVGDVVEVAAAGKILPVKVTEIFREEYVPSVNDYKMVRRTNLGKYNKDKSQD